MTKREQNAKMKKLQERNKKKFDAHMDTLKDQLAYARRSGGSVLAVKFEMKRAKSRYKFVSVDFKDRGYKY